MNSPTVSIWKMVLIAIVVGMVVYFAMRPFFLHSADLDWDQTSAVFPNPTAPQTLIHGWSKSPLEEWRYSFLWKAGEDKWLVYDLESHGTTWERYELRQEGGLIHIDCNGKVMGVFDPAKGEFNHVQEKRVDKTPTATIHAANLEHEAKWVYWNTNATGS